MPSTNPAHHLARLTDAAATLSTPAEVAERVKLDYGHLIPGIVGGEVIEVEAFGDRQTVRTDGVHSLPCPDPCPARPCGATHEKRVVPTWP